LKHQIDIVEMVRLYVEDGLTSPQIGERMGVPQRTVHRYLKKAGAPIRKRSDPSHKILADREWLENEYYWKGRSTPHIAAEVGCTARTVLWWLNRHEIMTRPAGAEKGHYRNSSEETREKLRQARIGLLAGHTHPNWKGGVRYRDPERYTRGSVQWTAAVKERDGWKCVECGSADDLETHHIKRWVDHPELRHDLDNGVTLCKACHQREHRSTNWLKYVKRPKSAPVPRSAG
jgi:hypothetical protein